MVSSGWMRCLDLDTNGRFDDSGESGEAFILGAGRNSRPGTTPLGRPEGGGNHVREMPCLWGYNQTGSRDT